MAPLSEIFPVTVPALLSAKGRERIAMMTAYDAPSAALLDAAGLDVLLVGDSVEMTVYGQPNTLSATMDSLVRHAVAVSGAAKRALVVGDMPGGAPNAGRFLSEAGCAAVKVEGGRRVLPAIEAILAADIPVMGHLGLTPQSYRKLGGFKVQGRDEDAAKEILEDAATLSDAGCFAIVLECVPEGLAAEITRTIPVPTIGIGAGPSCDGQVLVFHDVMGLSHGVNPRFVRRYADLSTIIEEAARAYTRDVKDGSFPSQAESYAGTKLSAVSSQLSAVAGAKRRS
jgi:3-methyl-2-oxobutanoate hydroxymethyltransferase